MDDPPSRPGAKKESEIAAAEWLFRDIPSSAANRPPGPVITPGSVEGFDLADNPGPAASPPSVPSSGGTGTKPSAGATRSRVVLGSSPPVLQTWSRIGEWGPALLVLACWGLALLFVLYFTVGAELYELSGLVFVAGCVGAVLLTYPILITLERPVRITPEQAARDYFGAMSHHLPHYRRMWLLLSSRGRVSSHFASYEGFKGYWATRLNQLRQGHAGPFSPLVFLIEEFRSEKSGGKTEIEGRFKVKVFIRGRRSQGPIRSFAVARSFARGPDSMWYLDDGTLADPPSAGTDST
jgi:hypothetical protein